MPALSAPGIVAPANEPPFWLPLLLALPLLGGMALLALPLLGHGPASVSRTLFLTTLLGWLLPLTALQRLLWRRALAPGWLVLALLLATLGMALATRAGYLLLQSMRVGKPVSEIDPDLFLRGLDAPWLALAAYAALHAVLAHAWALRTERQRLREAQALTREAELRALRLQLQPHFLFNALNGVSALVGDGRAQDAQAMLARLADFLRATLAMGHADEVALADELALVDSYLAIEKVRLGRRLQLTWSVGSGVLGARVPWMLLQPLVENAIRHGIARRREPGCLDVRITAQDARLLVEVANDLPPDNTPSMTDLDDATGGIGLRNLAERLSMLYPRRHLLRSGRGTDGRWRVELAIPLRLHEAAS